jgi:hypothetical protein
MGHFSGLPAMLVCVGQNGRISAKNHISVSSWLDVTSRIVSQFTSSSPLIFVLTSQKWERSSSSSCAPTFQRFTVGGVEQVMESPRYGIQVRPRNVLLQSHGDIRVLDLTGNPSFSGVFGLLFPKHNPSSMTLLLTVSATNAYTGQQYHHSDS